MWRGPVRADARNAYARNVIRVGLQVPFNLPRLDHPCEVADAREVLGTVLH